MEKVVPSSLISKLLAAVLAIALAACATPAPDLPKQVPDASKKKS